MYRAVQCTERCARLSPSRLVSDATSEQQLQSQNPETSANHPQYSTAVGVQSVTLSWLDQRISNGSNVELPTGFEPKHKTWRSTSETKTLRALIGTSDAPATVVRRNHARCLCLSSHPSNRFSRRLSSPIGPRPKNHQTTSASSVQPRTPHLNPK